MAIAFARYQVPTTTLLRTLTALRAPLTPAPAPVAFPVPHPAALLPAPFHPVVIRPAIAPPAPVEVAAPVKEAATPTVTTGVTPPAPCADCKPKGTAPAIAAAMVEAPAPGAVAAPVPVLSKLADAVPEVPSDMRRVVTFLIVATLLGGLLVYAAKKRPR